MTKIKLPLIISLLIASSIGFSIEVQAQFSLSQNTVKNGNKQGTKPNIGAPTGRRRAGAGRNPDCPSSLTKLTALVPGDAEKSKLAPTVAAYPTYWFYVPELPETARTAELVLQVKDGKKVENVYRKPFTLSGKPGIISINPPQKPQYSLKENKTYHWYFHIYCGDIEETSDNFYVDGFVKKKTQTQTVDSDWDIFTNLAKQRRAKPQDATINQNWVNLLNKFGLSDLAKQPIIEHYNLEK